MMELHILRIPQSRASILIQNNKLVLLKNLLKSIFLNPKRDHYSNWNSKVWTMLRGIGRWNYDEELEMNQIASF
jgi:hypothetical protein